MSFFRFIKPSSLTFKERVHETDNVYSFVFTPDSALPWKAGQHGLLELTLPNNKTSRRMFSISSAPSENIISITTRYKPDNASDFKQALWDLKPGQKARLRGPVGSMFTREQANQHIMIAAGIGITPMRSMLKEAALNRQNFQFTLLHQIRDINHKIFENDLSSLASEIPNLKLSYSTDQADLISKTIDIHKQSNQSTNTHYYLSGPPKMLVQYRQLLKKLGVKNSNIHYDPFFGYK